MIRGDKQKVEELNSSDFYGSIIETGAGCQLASMLYRYPNASKTIFMSEQPYSREYQYHRYFTGEERAVSCDRVQKMLDRHWSEYYESKTDAVEGYNFCIASSVQTSHKGDKSSHGWVGVRYVSSEGVITRYYHFTSPRTHQTTREENIESYGHIVLEILHASMQHRDPEQCPIDMVLDDRKELMMTESIRAIGGVQDEGPMGPQHSILLLDPEGRAQRVEYLDRNYDKLCIYKGSFNPPTKAHVDLMDRVKCLYDENIPIIFCISRDTFGKGHYDAEDIVRRIGWINKMGYWCAIVKDPLFINTLECFRDKFSHKIIVPMGADTIERLLQDYDFDVAKMTEIFELAYDADIVVRERNMQNDELMQQVRKEVSHYIIGDEDMISSTLIRKRIKSGDYESAKEMLPDQVSDQIIESPLFRK